MRVVSDEQKYKVSRKIRSAKVIDLHSVRSAKVLGAQKKKISKSLR